MVLGCPAPCRIADRASWLAISTPGRTFASAFPVGFVSSSHSRELRRVGADLLAMEQTSHSAPSLSLVREDSQINYQGHCGCVYLHLAVSLFNFHVIWKQSLICLIFNRFWPTPAGVGWAGRTHVLVSSEMSLLQSFGSFFLARYKETSFCPLFSC